MGQIKRDISTASRDVKESRSKQVPLDILLLAFFFLSLYLKQGSEAIVKNCQR